MNKLVLQAAPFIARGVTTPRLMLDVVLALLPLVLAGIWYFGASALLVVLVATGTALAMEALLGHDRRSLRDGSALLTGILLGLVLPPAIPLWMVVVGSAAAMGLGKLVWGGLGNNLFNPALVGRAFLQAAFPGAMTTWAPASGAAFLARLQTGTLALPLMQAGADVVTSATPLARMKFEQQGTELLALLSGNIGGCIGETSAGLIMLGGLYLALRRAFDWRIPLSIFASVAVFSALVQLLDPTRYPGPAFMLLSGGLMFGAIYMATDPVTSPTTPRGAWIFGGGIGLLVVLIRLFGGLPEGVMYAILLMNAATPLIERAFQPRPFGRQRRGRPT
jgi:electron transport complex protein RnfD